MEREVGERLMDTDRTFHYTIETQAPIPEVLRELESALREEQFGVLWQLDLQGKLKEKGVGYERPFHILEVCNPAEAKRVLEENVLVGYFLPCKIVVYEDQGKTKIGLPKPTELIGLVGGGRLADIARDVENRLIGSIGKGVQAAEAAKS